MQRAMTRQAESDHERRATVISAERELQAYARLNDAANVMSVNPAAVQLRSPQTILDVMSERPTTIVLLVLIDLLRRWLRHGVGGDEPTVPSNRHTVAAAGRGG